MQELSDGLFSEALDVQVMSGPPSSHNKPKPRSGRDQFHLVKVRAPLF